MTYTLILGDPAYSSWSLRGWQLFDAFDIPTQTKWVTFANKAEVSVADQIPEHAPAKTVPCLILPDGTPVWDSLAIAEEIATRHPDKPLWPTDPSARAAARSVVAEMHSGFAHLRTDCPMNLRVCYTEAAPSADVLADLARLDLIWSFARNRFGADGPWLFGAFSIADVSFAPVAARLAGYTLPLTPVMQAYVDTHLADPSFRRWRSLGENMGPNLPWYARPYETQPWPFQPELIGQATLSGTAENDACPYSGEAPTHLMALNDRVFGFCNALCRDKTASDPAAWPQFMAMYGA